jgi:hypothetical protein
MTLAELPAPVLALLRSVEVEALPPVKKAGELVDLSLKPTPEELRAALTGGRTLASVDIEAVLDRVNLTALPPAWSPNTDYPIGSVIRGTSTDNYYVCSTPGRSGSSAPAFPLEPGATVSEGPSTPQLTWRAAPFPGGINLTPGEISLNAALTTLPVQPFTWKQSHRYAVGQVVKPSPPTDLSAPSDLYCVCRTAGESGSQEPAWPPQAGETVVEGPSDPQLTWEMVAIASQLGVDLDMVTGAKPPGTTNLDVALNAVTGTTAPGTADLDLIMATGIDATGDIKGTVKPVDEMRGTASGTVAQASGLEGTLTGAIGSADQATGTVQGTLGQLTTLVGTLAGRLRGSIVEALLPTEPVLTVRWCVENENGEPLDHGTDYLLKLSDDKKTVDAALTAFAPKLVFLPQFDEFIGEDAVALATRRIRCEVTLEAEGFGSETVKPDPVFVQVPNIPIPTAVAMRSEPMDPKAAWGRVLVAVPDSSPFDDVTPLVSRLRLVLAAAEVVIEGLDLLGLADDATNYPALVSALTELIAAAEHADDPLGVFHKADQELNLWWVGSWVWQGTSLTYYPFADIISSLVMVGPPKRELTCHVMDSFYERQGAFRITLGLACAVVPDLKIPPGGVSL